jgi:hypothetical protein
MGSASLVVGAFAGLMGCSDGATVIDARTQAPPGGDAEEAPAYIVSTRVFSPEADARTSYFYVVDSLDASTVIDPSRGLEMPGSARLFANEETGWIAIGSGEDSTITRYTVGPNGLVAGDRINLQPYGITSHWSDDLYFVSPTKLYYPDRTNEQLLIINPEEMAITGTIPLPEATREGYQANYGYEAIKREGQLLFTVGWFNWDDDVILGETGLVVIDTATDQLVRVDVDARCGGITTPVTLASGDTYLVASALAAANNRLGRLATAPCALRVLANEETFDASYARPLGDLVGGKLAGEPVYAGGEALYFRVFEASDTPLVDGQFSWEITGQSVWSWARWDVSEDVAVPDPALAPSTADVVYFRADNRTFGMESLDAEYSQTRLIELSAPGGLVERLTAPGFLQGLARAR